MKFSYNWIREFVPGLKSAPAALEKLITMKTAECEGIEAVGGSLAGACAALVTAVEPIAGSHNVIATVETGRYGTRRVICGAPNCRAGLTTAFLPLDAKVIDGVESQGMLASGAELGINRDHEGIVEITAVPGAPIKGCEPDSVIEIDNKSITHRPDLWGHIGMAREVAAIQGLERRDPAKLELIPSGTPGVHVEVADFNLCPRYSALVIENVVVRPSPLWMQYRLTAIGLNPINNMVDMTNYLMAEMAQPMHAFDARMLHGNSIFVRPARENEPFLALNGESYRIGPSNLVIADEKGAIALAGVIGGDGSAISDSTTRVVLESACFQASSIRKTSSAIKLRTDASIRFEKSQDPVNTMRALARAVELLAEIAPEARIVGGVADCARPIQAPAPIELRIDWLERKLGRLFEPAEVRTILERLEFGVTETAPRVFSVTVPSWRATKDVSMKDDLVEEVGRMIGYSSITPRSPLVSCLVPPPNPERAFQHGVRDEMVDLGYTEVYNYSFLSEEAVSAFGFDPAAHLRVANPIASDQALMRASLLPGIRKNVLENLKHRDSFRLFEVGHEIHPRSGQLPDEVPHMVAARYEKLGDGSEGLFELKRVAASLLDGAIAIPAPARSYEHPARAAAIEWRGEIVGRLFELHPSLIETGRAAVLDLDLRAVRSLPVVDRKFTPVRRYPSSGFDLSVIAPERELAAQVEASIASFAGPLLDSVEFVRLYTDERIGAGKKSISFRVTLASAERTLSSEEVSAARNQIIEGMRTLGYGLRV